LCVCRYSMTKSIRRQNETEARRRGC
jgi:hypothetical protein